MHCRLSSQDREFYAERVERKWELEEQHSISKDFEEYDVAYNYGNIDHEVVYISDDD